MGGVGVIVLGKMMVGIMMVVRKKRMVKKDVDFRKLFLICFVFELIISCSVE